MKILFKINIKLLILGILLIFSSVLFINLNEKNKINIISKNQEISSKTPDAKPLNSGSWTASFIHIISDNWSDQCDYVQERDGTLANPHIIENVTIDAENSPIGPGILIMLCIDYFIIRNCTILNTDSDYASIYLWDTTHGKIENNTCNFNNGYGITLQDCSNNTVFDNEINSNGNGGMFINDYCDNNTIINNTISNNDYFGIYLDHSDNNTIRGNTINNNGWDGVSLSDSDNNTIYENTINNNDWDGIWLDYGDYNNIYENTISNNDYGVFLTDSSYNMVYNNKFVYNNKCIVETGACTGNILTPNTCIPKPIVPSSDDDDDNDDDDDSSALAIPGYDIFIFSFALIFIVGTLSLFLLKKRTKSLKF